MKSLADCRLYTFIDTAYLHGRSPASVAEQLCYGGSDIIQLRAKDLAPVKVAAIARTILPITQRAGVRFVINDHVAIAREVGAQCCHLGQEDFFDTGHTHISELWETNDPLQIGLSTHAPEQAQRALMAGASYIAIGPVYATDTKPGVKPVTLEYVRWAAANLKIPWFTIGGINLKTIDEVLAAGAGRVCVVSAILNAPDITAACREFKKRLPAAG